MSETQLSQNKLKLKIYFRDDEVFNIKIRFTTGPEFEWDGKLIWSQHYTKVEAFYDCNGLHLAGEGKEGELNGEMFIPATSIKRLTVDHLPGHKFDKP